MNQFINDLSSSKPAPGGGAASAMFAALGTALTSMVCALTEGKEKYAEFEPDVKKAHAEILELQEKALELMEADKQAYMEISKAYSLPKEVRNEKLQKALIPATQVPFEMMKVAASGLEITNNLIGKTNKMAVSDLGCAALGLKAAMKGAWLNVYINLKCFEKKPQDIEDQAKALLEKYCPFADEIYNKVEAAI